MMNLFKKKSAVVSMAQGKLYSIEKSKDEVFRQKIMGDGFIVYPAKNEIVSPVDGEIVMLFPTFHAIGIKGNDGSEYLIHIGVDTVTLNGEGFSSFVTVNDHVTKGQKIMEVEFEKIEKSVPSIEVICLFTDGRKCRVPREKEVVLGEENIVEII